MSKRPTVLLTNDDGPPSSSSSPFLFPWYLHLTQTLGWDVKVVIPSGQRSWIGKAYMIAQPVYGRYYYPRLLDGAGETSEVSRPLREGEIAEWILLDGTPATCASIALHNLYPSQIDLVISGPNYGRNTSSAFALSSGTLGAALSSSLSLTRAIALSYGVFAKPVPEGALEGAHDVAGRVVQRLWDRWGRDEKGLRRGEVDLYGVNVPLVEGVKDAKVVWTDMHRSSYTRLFQPFAAPPTSPATDAPPTPLPASSSALHFVWAPDIRPLIDPHAPGVREGTDTWAINKGWVSVTPMRAAFEVGAFGLAGGQGEEGARSGRVWVEEEWGLS